MFGSEFGSVDQAALIEVIEAGARAEAAAAARRLAAIAELTARHTEPDDDRHTWLVDGWACAAAEIAAALGIGTRARVTLPACSGGRGGGVCARRRGHPYPAAG
ncbi:DUF222 domain-containing protein [Mycobacterium sp. IDR2000157661]|uniref:DUF222 domain-containing protein n=1 Tax=Mycobacterium sp. IDR2000157661 TaxID=2867005 RepID=UPI001EED8A6C|nr:DUF222 domain-containing protein [Mycobacterium sp. IDR2000157661]ULE35235.1 DUF222 domain-containing protein [Mycobacterium sp. IDR2000157661]